MHEFTPVRTLVEGILGEMEHRPSLRVKEVRVRHGSAYSDDVLRQAFAACVVGTALERAKLSLEPVMMPIQCGCGHHGILNVTEQDGYPFVCPSCKDLLEIEKGPDLELIELIYEKMPAGTK